LATADYAEDSDENPPPPELAEAFQAEIWGASALYPGTIPVRKLRRWGACLNIYRAVKSYQAGSTRFAQWAERNPGQFEIVAKIREMRCLAW